MVEVSLKSTSSPNPLTDQLKTIGNKIKCAPLRKLAFISRARVDSIRVRDVGQPPPSETTPICRAKDEGNHSYQSDPRKDGDNQALNLSVQRRDDYEEGADRSMEVEGHRG